MLRLLPCPQALHFVVRGLHAGSLAPDNLSNIFRQISCHCLLISVFGSVLAVLQPIQHRLIAAAQADFRVNPGAM